MKTLVRHWDDIGFSAWCELKEYVADFKVYRIVATDVVQTATDGTKHGYARGYQRAGVDFEPDPVESPEGAEVFLDGGVKWDGCSNWTFVDHGVMLHFCDKAHAESIGTLFSRLYDWAKELGMDRLCHPSA